MHLVQIRGHGRRSRSRLVVAVPHCARAALQEELVVRALATEKL